MSPTRRLVLHDVLAQHARARGAELAVGDGDVLLTWSELAERVDRCAGALRAEGVGRGDRVLWLGQNSFRVLELLLGCSRLGALFCAANWRQRAGELAFVVDDLTPAVLFTQAEEVGDEVAAGLSVADHRARTIRHDADGAEGYEAWCASAPAREIDDLTEPGDALLCTYTAAFDGRPNAAMLPHRAIVAQGLLMGPWMGVSARSRYLAAGPLFHVGVWMEGFATFLAGGANVFVRRSDGEALCRAIADFGCTSGYVVGPMVDAVVAANEGGRFDLSSMRGRRGHPAYDAWVGVDDSPWGRRPGGYGQTETMGMSTFALLSSADELGTHGRPSPLVQVRVVDPDGADVPVGETGEILVRGETVMCGYWNRPELNAVRSRGGWHHTNDLGCYEVDGSFSFVAPKGRMLKSGAENIYPEEVEQALRTHPAVAEVAVIGVPDEVWVQSVKAIVVRQAAATVTEAELIEHCRARIAGYKKPRTVVFVEALPRAGWQVDYAALDAAHGGGSYPGGNNRPV
ncbi:MAG: AMP-binding protein [Actinobacteria bacterium]|nr:AMP-binding protein [Actinomycetota bacterium]